MDEKNNPKTDEAFCVHRRSLQEKKIEKKGRRGRRSGLCMGEILAIRIWFNPSKCRDFKTFYRGSNGEFLRPFFPKMPNYSSFMKRIK
jgi:hypothetical protein